MSIQIGASGVWKNLDKAFVGVSGVWKELQGGWIGAGGVWKKLYDGTMVVLTNKSHTKISVQPNDAHAGYRIHSDGTVDGTAATTLSWAIDDGTWLVFGSASDYQVRATLNSGSLTSGTTGTWLSCGTTQAWSIDRTDNSAVTQSANLTIEIRDAATSTVRASCTVTLSIEITL